MFFFRKQFELIFVIKVLQVGISFDFFYIKNEISYCITNLFNIMINMKKQLIFLGNTFNIFYLLVFEFLL